MSPVASQSVPMPTAKRAMDTKEKAVPPVNDALKRPAAAAVSPIATCTASILENFV
jgi:hypothetical protein